MPPPRGCTREQGRGTARGDRGRARRPRSGTRGSTTRARPKTERALRTIELDDGLLKILRRWKMRSRFSKPGDLVVTLKSGRPLDHRAAARKLETIVERAGLDQEGLPKVTPHELRRSFGSLLLDAGESLSRVSRMLGHANEAITGQVYVHEIERPRHRERTRATMAKAFARDGQLVEAAEA